MMRRLLVLIAVVASVASAEDNIPKGKDAEELCKDRPNTEYFRYV